MIPNPEIDEWIKAVGQEKADQITQNANWRGTAMHSFIENFLIELKRSGDPSAALRHTQITSPKLLTEEKVPENKITEGRNLFYKFYESDYISDFETLIGTETPIYDPEYYFRGFIDWLLKVKVHGLAVRDFKTSSKPIEAGSRKELGYKFQLGAYASALENMYKKDGKTINVNYASIVCVQTTSNIVQNIELYGEGLNEYKKKYQEIAREWHIQNGQEFLFNK